jgi:RHS repeat-associated protein
LRTPPSGGSYQYSYLGNAQTVSDPANKQLRYFYDALGGLIQVDEPGPFAPGGGSGSVAVSGSLQTTSGSAGTGYITIAGSEQSVVDTSGCEWIGPRPTHCPTTWDKGTVTISINGYNATVNYAKGSDPGSIATGLANVFNADPNSPVSAGVSGYTVYVTARQAGAATNYYVSSWAVTSDPGDFGSSGFYTSQSGSNLTGGVDGTNDSGNCSITVGGYTSSMGYGPGSSASGIAYWFAYQISNDPSATVTATSSGNILYLTSKAVGASGNLGLSASCATSLPGTFASPSFTLTPSGSTLTGGHGAGVDLSAPLSTYAAYTALGKLTQITQGAQTRTIAYDGMGRVISQTTPEGGAVQAFYADSSGNPCSSDPSWVCSRVDARGFTTTYRYDGLGRVTFIGYPNSNTVSRSFYYDQGGSAANALGRLTNAGDAGPFPNHYETYTYDAAGRITQIGTVGVGDLRSSVSYQYNPMAEIAQITYPSGRIVTNSYDDIGRLNSVQSNGTIYFSNAGYSAAGQLVSFSYGNGVQSNLSYNDHEQLASLQYSRQGGSAGGSATALFNLVYNYTGQNGLNNGQLQGIADTRGAGYSLSFTYDPWSRLSAAQTNDLTAPQTWALTWPYDRYGNRLGQNIVGGTLPAGAPQLVIDPPTNHIVGFSYDQSGNMTTDGTPGRTWNYDAENRLTSQVNGNSSAVYGYDLAGLRISKNLWSTTGGTTTQTSSAAYVYSSDQVIAEYLNSNLNKEHIYAANKRIATVDSRGNVFYHHPDHLSNRLETDVNGNVVRTFGHLPFGDTWYETGNPDNWKFTTYERDAESGLDYAQARYYESGFGRFLSPDPLPGDLSSPQSLNRYTYVMNNPVTNLDPHGKECGDSLFEGCGEIDGGGGAGFGFGFDLFNMYGGGGDQSNSDDPFLRAWAEFGFDMAHMFDEGRAFGMSDRAFGESMGIPDFLQLPQVSLLDWLPQLSKGCEFGPCGFQSTGLQPVLTQNCLAPGTGGPPAAACIYLHCIKEGNYSSACLAAKTQALMDQLADVQRSQPHFLAAAPPPPDSIRAPEPARPEVPFSPGFGQKLYCTFGGDPELFEGNEAMHLPEEVNLSVAVWGYEKNFSKQPQINLDGAIDANGAGAQAAYLGNYANCMMAH